MVDVPGRSWSFVQPTVDELGADKGLVWHQVHQCRRTCEKKHDHGATQRHTISELTAVDRASQAASGLGWIGRSPLGDPFRCIPSRCTSVHLRESCSASSMATGGGNRPACCSGCLLARDSRQMGARQLRQVRAPRGHYVAGSRQEHAKLSSSVIKREPWMHSPSMSPTNEA